MAHSDPFSRDMFFFVFAQSLSGFSQKEPLRNPASSDHQLGVSENSVPLNPMVNDHYPYEKWL